MEGLHNLNFVPPQGDYMCKLNLKGTYFSIPFQKDPRKMVHFQWYQRFSILSLPVFCVIFCSKDFPRKLK